MKVIIATDGSPGAEIARATLERLSLPDSTDFTVAMATHLPVMATMGLVPTTVTAGERIAADYWEVEHRHARATTDRIVESLREKGLCADGVVLEGDTGERLLGLIGDEHADLVAAGSGVNSNIEAFFLGSISRKLVLYSEASVLIGRRYAGKTPEESLDLLQGKKTLNVLVAVDGSTGAALALDFLSQMRQTFDTAYVLTVQPTLSTTPIDYPHLVSSDLSASQDSENVVKQAAEAIASCAKHVERLTSYGRPATEICRAAAEKNVDLVVMGANRHGALERFIVGSCAYETATEAPCSVLILRDQLSFSHVTV
jgi:nucleotide-binding universal stress UspA family protein